VLSFAGAPVTYRELLLTGAATGLLSAMVAEAATGERLLRSSPEGPPRDAVRAEARRFRRGRHLESGEDLRVWLTARGLTLDDFDHYLSRAVARADEGSGGTEAEPAELIGAAPTWAELAGEDPDELTDRELPQGELSSKLLFSELACSGGWRIFSGTAVRHFAAEQLSLQDGPARPRSEARPEPGDGTGGDSTGGEGNPVLPLAEVLKVLQPFGAFDPAWCAERLEVLHSRARALDEIERQVRASDAVAARLEGVRSEWALFVYDELQLRSRGAAMEALSCSSADGLAAEEIAERAGSALTARRGRRQELPAGHAALLDGAARDEAVGPVENAGGFSVLWLCQRARPDGTDPEAVERAVGELVAEALDRASLGAVREIGEL
jgi:hypothetical protein